MRRTYVPVVVLASLALVALLVYGVIGAGDQHTLDDAVKKGERPSVPDRTLPLVAGGEGSIGEYRGKPVIVNFWASWCEPCKDEAPLLERAHARLRKVGGTVLGITVSDASDDSRAFMRAHGLSFPSLRDVEGKLGNDFETTGVPESFVVDREGKIVSISRGQVDKAFVDQAIALVGSS